MAAELVFDPATPSVEVGKQITLSVSGTSGAVTWTPSKGQIQGAGNQVTYLAPAETGVDSVMVLDDAGNAGLIKITVLPVPETPKPIPPPTTNALENANWEVFTDRSDIETLLLSDDGKTLWVGTGGGLEQRDASTGELVRVFTNLGGLPSNEINALESDGSGGLWIGTSGGLTYRSVSGEWTLYTEDNSELPDDEINAIESDGNGGLWIGTAWYGLAYRSVSGELTVYTEYNSGLPSNYVSVLESDGNGGLWIGAYGGGGLAYRSTSGEWTVYNKDNSELPSNYVSALESDGSGGLWIGTSPQLNEEENIYNIGGGLAYRSVSGEWTVYTKDNSGLPSNNVYALESDGSGGLWIGTHHGLAYRSVSSEWMVYNKELPDNLVSAILRDGSGGLWIGTGNYSFSGDSGGLVYRSVSGEWTVYMEDNSGLPDNSVHGLLRDGSDGLWIATMGWPTIVLVVNGRFIQQTLGCHLTLP